MENFLDTFNHFDLRTSNENKLKDKISKLQKDDIITICESLAATLPIIDATSEANELDKFDFVSSNTLGAAHLYGCEGFDCRIDKVMKLGSFSLLYADKVYLPDYFSVLVHMAKNISLEELKIFFYNDVYIINVLRDAIKKGYIKIAKTKVSRNTYKSDLEVIDKIIGSELIEILEAEYIDETKCVKNGNKRVEVFTSGDLIEHESVYVYSDKYDSFKNGYIFNKDDMIHSGIVKNLLLRGLNDIKYNRVISDFTGASFLTNNNSQDKILSRISSDNHGQANDALKMLFLETPIFDNVPISKILKLRECEGDSFENYRNSIYKSLIQLSKINNNLTPKVVMECYNEQIKPELRKVDIKIKNHKKSLIKNTITNVSMIGLGLTVGLASGVFNPDILKAFGAVSTGAQLLTTAANAFAEPIDIKSSDFYFLWNINKAKVKDL